MSKTRGQGESSVMFSSPRDLVESETIISTAKAKTALPNSWSEYLITLKRARGAHASASPQNKQKDPDHYLRHAAESVELCPLPLPRNPSRACGPDHVSTTTRARGKRGRRKK
eukprot:543851-Rhodomonas_salina.1